jgi:hypothetical protein
MRSLVQDSKERHSVAQLRVFPRFKSHRHKHCRPLAIFLFSIALFGLAPFVVIVPLLLIPELPTVFAAASDFDTVRISLRDTFDNVVSYGGIYTGMDRPNKRKRISKSCLT